MAIELSEAIYDEAAQAVIDLGNRILDTRAEPDEMELASGLLAGAIEFWLFSRQPCEDPLCETCADRNTAEKRLRSLTEEMEQSARESDYYHTRYDENVGTA